MSIKFYYAPRSNASRIRWTLEELGVPYEQVRIDLRAGDQRKPEFLALNPNGKVPTLVLDDTPLFESVAIQIALGERFGVDKGLWPAPGSPEHHQALSWIVWGQVTFGAALFRRLMNTSDWFSKESHNALQAEDALKEMNHCLAILNARLDDRHYLTGPRFTLVDLDLASVLAWGLQATGVDRSQYPNVKAWHDRCVQRPAMKVLAEE